MSVAEVIEPEMLLRRFRSYTAYKKHGVAWLGEIPAHWDAKRLKDLAGLKAGTAITSDKIEPEGDYPVFGGNGLRGYTLSHTHDGEFPLVGRQGALCGCVTLASGKFWASEHAIVVTPRAAVDPRWLADLLRAMSLNGYPQSAAQPGLAVETIGVIPVPAPSIQEQGAISAFLDRETTKIDALVAKKEQLIALLQEKRIALITRAVNKGLDPNAPMRDSGVEWLGKIPAHWEVKRIKDLSSFVTSGSRGWADHYTDEGSLFLRIGNLKSGSIDLDLSAVQHVSPPLGAEGERTRVCAGDLLISITALIGAVGVVPEGIPTAFVNQHLALVRLSNQRVAPRWLAYCVLSSVGQEQFRAELYGGTKDGLNLDDVRSLVVLLPPEEERQRTVDLLDYQGRQVDGLVSEIREAIDRLKELRIALISAAVTGKIDVREEAA
jgi:type I restriction enzyme S subunit